MQRDDAVKKSGAAAAVIWHAILWAKANSYHTFDFGGIPADAVEMIKSGDSSLMSQLTGPTVFKASFGGQPYRYPHAVELISSVLLRTCYDLSRRSAVGGEAMAMAKRLLRGGKSATARNVVAHGPLNAATTSTSSR
jgi:hypothetical protein